MNTSVLPCFGFRIQLFLGPALGITNLLCRIHWVRWQAVLDVGGEYAAIAEDGSPGDFSGGGAEHVHIRATLRLGRLRSRWQRGAEPAVWLRQWLPRR